MRRSETRITPETAMAACKGDGRAGAFGQPQNGDARRAPEAKPVLGDIYFDVSQSRGLTFDEETGISSCRSGISMPATLQFFKDANLLRFWDVVPARGGLISIDGEDGYYRVADVKYITTPEDGYPRVVDVKYIHETILVIVVPFVGQITSDSHSFERSVLHPCDRHGNTIYSSGRVEGLVIHVCNDIQYEVVPNEYRVQVEIGGDTVTGPHMLTMPRIGDTFRPNANFSTKVRVLSVDVGAFHNTYCYQTIHVKAERVLE